MDKQRALSLVFAQGESPRAISDSAGKVSGTFSPSCSAARTAAGEGHIPVGEYERAVPRRTFVAGGRQQPPPAECSGTSPIWSRPTPYRQCMPRGRGGQDDAERLRPLASSTSSGQASSGLRRLANCQCTCFAFGYAGLRRLPCRSGWKRGESSEQVARKWGFRTAK